MASQIALSIDDKDLDDAALWAVIDSAAASHSSKSRKPLYLKHTPTSIPNVPPQSRSSKTSRQPLSPPEGEVLHEPWLNQPTKIARFNVSEVSERSPLAMVKRVPRTPITPVYSSPQSYSSPDSGWFSETEYGSGTKSEAVNLRQREEEEDVRMRHSLSGRFPTVSLFKEYQNAAMAILEKSDYTMISGHPFIKKSGWRKISFYFNLSFEIKDKTIEFDENRNVQRAEFVVRAHMHGGRFSDGWGSSDRREKKFNKPNHDIPSTAETRAKNKACQDLLGIGEYHPGESHFQ